MNTDTHHHHHHHHQQQQQLYSPGWALASSRKCRQRPLSWASSRQFLQPSFLVSSSAPSFALDFGRPHPRLPPGFVHSIFLGNSFSSIRTTWPTHLSLLDFITLTMVNCKALPVFYCTSSTTALPRISDQIFCKGFTFRRYSFFFCHILP